MGKSQAKGKREGTGKGIATDLRKAIAAAEAGGMSRYAIAKAAGIATIQVSRVADGLTIPRLDTAERICRVIGLRLSLVTDMLPSRK